MTSSSEPTERDSKTTNCSLSSIEFVPGTQPLFEVHWILTRHCTYACQYCPPHRHDRDAFEPDADSLISGLDKLSQILKGRSVRLNLTGGEPTFHPAIVSFLRSTFQFQAYQRIRLVTNFSMPLRLYTEIAELGRENPGRLEMVCSYHFGQARVRHFIERLEVVLGANIDVLVKLIVPNDDPPDYHLLTERLYDLTLNNDTLFVRVQRVRGAVGLTLLGDRRWASDNAMLAIRWNESRQFCRSDGEGSTVSEYEDIDEIISRGENHFFGWSCDAGIASLFVDNDGRVFSALCKPEAIPLFNLFTSDKVEIKLPQHGVRCPHGVCECAATIRVPKRLERMVR